MAYIRVLNLTESVPYFSSEWCHNIALPLVQEDYYNSMSNFPIFDNKKNIKWHHIVLFLPLKDTLSVENMIFDIIFHRTDFT